MRKYFSDEKGNLVEFMQDGNRPNHELLDTIYLQKNILKTSLPD
jgi:hypothetical protein